MIRKISYRYSKRDVENIERICKKIKEIKAGDKVYFPLKTDIAGQIDECIVKSAESKGNVITIKFSPDTDYLEDYIVEYTLTYYLGHKDWVMEMNVYEENEW